jgi:hypothetical protein
VEKRAAGVSVTVCATVSEFDTKTNRLAAAAMRAN